MEIIERNAGIGVVLDAATLVPAQAIPVAAAADGAAAAAATFTGRNLRSRSSLNNSALPVACNAAHLIFLSLYLPIYISFHVLRTLMLALPGKNTKKRDETEREWECKREI